jgi:hypothetical protein
MLVHTISEINTILGLILTLYQRDLTLFNPKLL